MLRTTAGSVSLATGLKAFKPFFKPLAATSPTPGISPTAKAAVLTAVPRKSPAFALFTTSSAARMSPTIGTKSKAPAPSLPNLSSANPLALKA